MTLLPPRARFHLVLWSQLLGAIMVLSGMFPYWIKLHDASLPTSIYWRAVTSAVVLFLMFAVPLLINSWNSVVGPSDSDDIQHSEPLAHNPQLVRVLSWSYCIFDLALLSYLVHLTGGLTGSMYSGLYLLIPSLTLLLMLSSADLRYVLWLIALTMIGIALAYWMSDTPTRIESNAAQHPAAFSFAVALISWEGAILIFIQVAILKHQLAPAPHKPYGEPGAPQKHVVDEWKL